MKIAELKQIRRKWLDNHLPYKMTYWRLFNYDVLNNIMYRKKGGRGSNETYNDIIIMFDTETSKQSQNETKIVIDKKTKNRRVKYKPVPNYVVAWSICLFAFERPLVTLYGNSPSEMVQCFNEILDHMEGYETYVYAHNLAYDWRFCKKFLIDKWGKPVKQLNTKPQYPINIVLENGQHRLILKDSLILSQCKLEKWTEQLNVEHKKAVGKWDYNRIRTQWEKFTKDELKYIECDVLGGCECIFTEMNMLKKSIASMPYTATGIPREEVRKLAKENNWRDRFLSMCPNYDQYIKLTDVYHGGYTHANRHWIDLQACHYLEQYIVCYDFSSSYPYCLIAEKFPMEKFSALPDCDVDYILRNSENYAFMFKLILNKPKLKNDNEPMPALQLSKCKKDLNAVVDNGRILCAEYVEIYLTEQDLKVIVDQYDISRGSRCIEVECAIKDYLPRWFTDYVYKLYTDKCKLKHSDPVYYNLQKAKLNSLYGMCVQKYLRDTYIEDYDTGEYKLEPITDPEDAYNRHINKWTTILPYFWGVWVTAYAFDHLFELGKCAGDWVYSDTDSCYGANWDIDKLNAYNEKCKEKLLANGYGAVEFDGDEYWLGVAEFDGSYSEFITCGAKRYACRYSDDPRNEKDKIGTLKITVAGVPKKKGAECLHDDINNFKKGFVFDGVTTGKLTHMYIDTEQIEIIDGIEYGDSIDLVPCDYVLDDVESVDWESIFYDEIEVQIYDD